MTHDTAAAPIIVVPATAALMAGKVWSVEGPGCRAGGGCTPAAQGAAADRSVSAPVAFIGSIWGANASVVSCKIGFPYYSAAYKPTNGYFPVTLYPGVLININSGEEAWQKPNF